MTYHDDDTSEASDFDDPEIPDASDMDDADDDESETVPCPYCRKPVYESVERCPYCGSYISEEDAPRRHPWWIVAGVIVCLVIIVLFWVL